MLYMHGMFKIFNDLAILRAKSWIKGDLGHA